MLATQKRIDKKDLPVVSKYAGMPRNELARLLHSALDRFRGALSELAEIVAECWVRGMEEELSVVPKDILDQCRRIGSGKIYGPFADDFAGTAVYDRAKIAPVDYQKRLHRIRKLKVPVFQKGKVVLVDKPLLDVSVREVRMCIKNGRELHDHEKVAEARRTLMHESEEADDADSKRTPYRIDVTISVTKDDLLHIGRMREKWGGLPAAIKAGLMALE